MHFITSGDFKVPENIVFEDIGNKKLKVYRVKNIDKEINGKIERKEIFYELGVIPSHKTYLHRHRVIDVKTELGDKFTVRVDELKKIINAEAVQVDEDLKGKKNAVVPEKMTRTYKKQKQKFQDEVEIGKVNYEEETIGNENMIPYTEIEFSTLKDDDVSKATDGISDYKMREKQIKRKAGKEDFRDFAKNWNGELNATTFQKAWHYQEEKKEFLKKLWTPIRIWLNEIDEKVTVGSWNKDRHIEAFLSATKNDRATFNPIFALIEQQVSSAEEKDQETTLRNYFDDFFVSDPIFKVFEDKELRNKGFENFLQASDAKKIYSIIQDVFQDKNILTLSQPKYVQLQNEVVNTVNKLIAESRAKVEALNILIQNNAQEEASLAQFIKENVLQIAEHAKVDAEGQQVNDDLIFSRIAGSNIYKSNMGEVLSKFKKKCSIYINAMVNEKYPRDEIANESLKDYFNAIVDETATYIKRYVFEEIKRSNSGHRIPNIDEIKKPLTKEKLDRLFDSQAYSNFLGSGFISACEGEIYQANETKQRMMDFFHFLDEMRDRLPHR